MYVTSLPHCCYRGHEFNKCVFVKHSDTVSYFLVILIFYCANTTAFHNSYWKMLEGVNRLNLIAKWVAA